MNQPKLRGLALLLTVMLVQCQNQKTEAAGHPAFPPASPEWLGMDRTKLETARGYALQGGGSGCVIRGGKLVMAWGDQKQRYDLYSTTKSIGVTALGLALMDGKVRLEDKARTHLPEVGLPPEINRASGWLDELTLFHLATQTGGFEKTRGWCRQLHRPGTTWIYSDGGPNWLADCLTMAYQRDLLEVMTERVFRPLGISVGDTPAGGEHDLHWGFNKLDRPRQLQGINRRPLGAGIHANVEAMARIGYLYLRRGPVTIGRPATIPNALIPTTTYSSRFSCRSVSPWRGRLRIHPARSSRALRGRRRPKSNPPARREKATSG